MRCSLLAGPSIKYEVVNLLAGSSLFFFDEMQPLRWPFYKIRSCEPPSWFLVFFFDEMQPPSWPIYKIRSCEPPSWFLGFDEMQPLQSWHIYKIRCCEPPSWFLWISWMGVRSLNEY